MNKKGFELQFHWIFVLIAGALILAFFVSVAYKQRSFSEQKLSLSLSADMEGVFTAAIQGKGAAQVIPNPKVTFQCTQGCDCSFGVGRARRGFGEKSIFALTKSAPSLVVWSREVKLPYRLANVLLVTDPQVKYYLVGDRLDREFIQLTRSIPVFQTKEGVVPVINYENVTPADLSSLRAQEDISRFVFVGVEPDFIDGSFEGREVSAIKLDVQGISFFLFEEGAFIRVADVPRADLTTVFAAMFSVDANSYRCGMQSLGRKAAIVARVYIDRAQDLKEYASAQGFIQCPVLYDNLLENLQSQESSAKLLATTLQGSALAGLAQGKELLESQNRELVQANCPELF
ncbi:MAG TPA: hypothetical protein VJJ82_03875 [Candidatus Nanoarchaeia archaeon]|nr:hypothetical protein [Candidatus Nanoarchaeia archaeon]